jgi:hypothetical protein
MNAVEDFFTTGGDWQALQRKPPGAGNAKPP